MALIAMDQDRATRPNLEENGRFRATAIAQSRAPPARLCHPACQNQIHKHGGAVTIAISAAVDQTAQLDGTLSGTATASAIRTALWRSFALIVFRGGHDRGTNNDAHNGLRAA